MAFKISNTTIIDNSRGVTTPGIVVHQEGFVLASNAASLTGAAPATGTNYGYNVGGTSPATSLTYNVIERFSFSVDGNSTDISDLAIKTRGSGGSQSATHGYVIGGEVESFLSPIIRGSTCSIQKFPFSSGTNASGVGNYIGYPRWRITGHASETKAFFTSGGGQVEATPTNPLPGVTSSVRINSFPHSAENFVTYVGDMMSSNIGGGQGAISSATHGYATGGVITTPPYNTAFSVIQKFPFSAIEGGAYDVGDLSLTRGLCAGISDNQNGTGQTAGGGLTPGARYSRIDRFPFSTEVSATNIGDLNANIASGAGVGSTTHGYFMGGINSGGTLISVHQKWSLTTGGTAATVGTLTAAPARVQSVPVAD